jgi:hypothetical protein
LLNREQPPSLPAHVYAAGPLWLESWRGLPIEEELSFAGRTRAEVEALASLRGRLYRISKEHGRLPKPLTRAARDLVDLLYRPEELRDRGFRVTRQLSGARLWVAVPLDYPSFLFVEGEHGREMRPLDVDSQPVWRDGLQRAVSAESSLLAMDPVIPLYRAGPFLSFQTTGDPTGLSRAFDGRYFMASTELNLLNTLLFVGD